MKKRLILNTANPDFSKLEFLEKFNAAARADVENIGYDTFQQPGARSGAVHRGRQEERVVLLSHDRDS